MMVACPARPSSKPTPSKTEQGPELSGPFTMANEKPDIVSRVLHGIASLALVGMMLVVVSDVALRFIFNTPVRGAYDMVSVGLLVMVFFGIGPVILRGSEILIDLIDGIASKTLLRTLRLISAVGTIAVFLFLGWSMMAPAMDAWRYGDRSLELGIPTWTLWVIAFVGLAGILWGSLLALRLAVKEKNQPPHDPASGEEGAL